MLRDSNRHHRIPKPTADLIKAYTNLVAALPVSGDSGLTHLVPKMSIIFLSPDTGGRRRNATVRPNPFFLAMVTDNGSGSTTTLGQRAKSLIKGGPINLNVQHSREG